MEGKYYWLKSNGNVDEIPKDKFIRLNQNNISNPCHKLAWKVNDSVMFCQGETGVWIDINQIKEILN